MNFFNSPLKDLFGLGSIIKDESPTSRVPSLSREDRQQARKDTEDLADKIHPNLGNAVRKANNTQDSIENMMDSIDFGKVIVNQIFNKVKEEELCRGDHLFTQAAGYTHHGLYVGNNEVIHYAHDSGKNYISIRKDSITTFADNKSILRKNEDESPAHYSDNEIISRANRRLGEQSYNLAANNCENFVRWCRHGGEEYENR